MNPGEEERRTEGAPAGCPVPRGVADAWEGDGVMIWLMSIAGVVIAVGLAAALYGWPQPTLSFEEARRAYLADCFTDRVRGVWVDGTRRVALLALADSAALGLVLVMGDKLVTRRLTPALIRTVEEESDGLVLRLNDLVLPRVRFCMNAAESEDGSDRAIRDRLVEWQQSVDGASGLRASPEAA